MPVKYGWILIKQVPKCTKFLGLNISKCTLVSSHGSNLKKRIPEVSKFMHVNNDCSENCVQLNLSNLNVFNGGDIPYGN